MTNPITLFWQFWPFLTFFWFFLAHFWLHNKHLGWTYGGIDQGDPIEAYLRCFIVIFCFLFLFLPNVFQFWSWSWSWAWQYGVATFLQGTAVQGQFCPRDISIRRLLSKETLVQGDCSPRYRFEALMAVHIIFFLFYNQ